MPFDPLDEPYEITDRAAAEVQRHDGADPRGDINQPRTQHEREQAESRAAERRETDESNGRQTAIPGVEITFDSDEVVDKLGVFGLLGGLF